MTDLVVTVDPDMAQNQSFAQLLDTNGDGTGEVDGVGNYTNNEVDLFIEPLDGSYKISRLVITIVDKKGFNHNEYGNLNHSLNNGVVVKIRDNVLATIKTNLDWTQIGCHVDQIKWSKREMLRIVWGFMNACGQYIRLCPGDRLSVHLADDFRGLDEHRFLVQGYKEDSRA